MGGEFRRFWDESFERLDEYLAELQKEKKTDDNQGETAMAKLIT